MAKIIEFLEQLGQDADLRHATDAELEAALIGAAIDAPTRAAVLRRDQRRLEALLDVDANVCCMVATPMKEDEDDEEEAEEEEEVEGDKDKEAKDMKSNKFPSRRAA